MSSSCAENNEKNELFFFVTCPLAKKRTCGFSHKKGISHSFIVKDFSSNSCFLKNILTNSMILGALSFHSCHYFNHIKMPSKNYLDWISPQKRPFPIIHSEAIDLSSNSCFLKNKPSQLTHKKYQAFSPLFLFLPHKDVI